MINDLDFYKRIVQNASVLSPYEIYRRLEAYGFCSNEMIRDEIYGNKPSVDKIPDGAIQDGDIFYCVDNGACTVYYCMEELTDVHIGSVALAADTSVGNIQCYGVTPHTIEPLKIDDQDLLFKRIIIEALKLGASDVHFDVKHRELKPVYTVSFREGTSIVEHPEFELDKSMNSAIISNLVMRHTELDNLDLLDPSGIVCSVSDLFGDGNVELRVSANGTRDGYHYVIRIQKKSTFTFTIESLGFDEVIQEALHRVSTKLSGITLITGAIRTGKNTTAFALANEMVKQPINILSYESPIEALMPFTQVDYRGDTRILTEAVRLAKKQDVNVAFLNEIPDKSVAFSVQDLANSSIHVITTMHMDRIWHLPYKLFEYYGDDYKNILSQINCVFNQKMFVKSCPHCSRPHSIDAVKSERVKNFLVMNGVKSFMFSPGCEKCDFTGETKAYQPYVEFMEMNESLLTELLSCEHPYQMELIIKKAVRESDITLERFMIEAVKAGKLSPAYLEVIL